MEAGIRLLLIISMICNLLVPTSFYYLNLIKNVTGLVLVRAYDCKALSIFQISVIKEFALTLPAL